MTPSTPQALDAEQVATLLAELDERLCARGVAASIFVVGGAAIAMTGVRTERLTRDVDALARDAAVFEEARAIAANSQISADWLNPRAGMWMPPPPDGVLDPPAEPGLRVTYADEGYLFATKLVAQRGKDAGDLVALARRLGVAAATPQQLEQHIRRYYTDLGALEIIVGGRDVDHEISMLARDASRMLKRAAGSSRSARPVDGPGRVTRLEPPGIDF